MEIMNTLAAQAVPEILAPAGGRAQFFAALQSGADAVYLGMKSFNARARAENFGEDDLRELVPLAHAFGMRVLVAVNVLIKEAELPELVRTLSSLEELEVDAIIVQDLGVARLAQTHFPKLRLHASTQMAVHNEAGVRAAFEFGFRRVVVARELTAVEMKRIRAAAPRPDANGDGGIEIEAFCHGSLCYSYSGLCFFSGSEDARSGNRGECAYTCRQPYKITSEPGHGFLFSMKDLDTSASIRHFVEAGIDTLKIEGRKKDAQYVSSTVRLYRSALDQHFGRSTLRANAPEAARAFDGEAADGIERDLALSFHRGRTSFFLNGRYVENVIDLASPTHLGLECGKVTAVHGRRIAFATQTAIERFDGLKIVAAGPVFHARPQDGDRVRGSTETMSELYERKAAEFSLRELTVAGKRAFAAAAGTIVEVEMPDGVPMPVVGDEVRKIRSADLKRRVERLESVPEGARLRSLRNVEIEVAATQLADALCIEARATKFGSELTRAKIEIPALRSTKDGSWRSDAEDAFAILGDVGFAATRLAVSGDADWFVPRSRLKELKRELAAKLPAAYAAFVAQRLQAGLDTLSPAIAHREGGPAFAMRYGWT